MNGLGSALSVEFLKSRRSKVPWAVGAAFALGPIVGGIFMLILKDPERARQLGVLGAKAEITAGKADWPTYTALVSQAIAIAGGILFAFLFAWLFGREWADRTVRNIVASPTSRSSIVVAKLVVGAGWSLAMIVWVVGLALAIGLAVDGLVGLPGGSVDGVTHALASAAAAGVLLVTLQTFTAFFAGAGRGYIPAFAWAVLSIFLAQIFAALGWGAWFPWSVPALVTGAAGPEADPVTAGGVLVVLVAAALGLAATLAWWERVDQQG